LEAAATSGEELHASDGGGLQLLEKSYMPLMEGVKSEEGPTARLQHLLSSALKQGGVKDGVFQWTSMSWPLKEPEGALRPGFI